MTLAFLLYKYFPYGGMQRDFRRFVESEVPHYADQMLTPPSRRNFLKIMGASLALAGMTGCRWPKENITPYARRPANRTPGVPVHYATANDRGGVATGLLVRSYDGRPIKVEGNPEHPTSPTASHPHRIVIPPPSRDDRAQMARNIARNAIQLK